MAKDAGEFANEHLEAFKEKMRITHEAEDHNLLRMLKSSVTAVAVLVGAPSYDDSLLELTLERAMCEYHDALDEFKTIYAHEIEDLYLINLIKASKEG